MTTTITLIRHGETDWNVEGRWQGFAPVPLNANGMRQAREAAPYLKTAGIDRIVASDLLRARQTAEIVAETLSLPVAFDSRWREIDLGNWQGLTQNEISAWDPENHSAFDQASYLDRRFPDGENNRQHIQRTAKALHAVLEDHPGEHTLVATHGGSIRGAIYHITGERIHLTGNCSLTRLRYNGGTWDVLGIAQAPSDVIW